MAADRNARDQGMNWIRKEKRLAIYLRDGLACVYCGATVEGGATLTLDHLRAHSHEGSNNATNLVTSCRTCNSSRSTRSWKAFAAAAAEYRGVDAPALVRFIHLTRNRVLDVPAAAALMAARGGFVQALKATRAA